ncbi:VPLPA-CTERM sorting domain-containing protein [Poseidonocella sedimentorum]|uniref:VPLPA-CTERM protein sorting domain-containing protein n=1 Tax=Poseidonocella sedimentorum TaxID=871652 RepID=A0A1I6EI06_9RHOB|nr:VPLPA-CTERM sorting domain-containing protein [Poseidonocella sedimentorum]SFR17396.1 VPLPA-CTERM protein sorting domain-containing protein [Poseidonocella sedimentorum]
MKHLVAAVFALLIGQAASAATVVVDTNPNINTGYSGTTITNGVQHIDVLANGQSDLRFVAGSYFGGISFALVSGGSYATDGKLYQTSIARFRDAVSLEYFLTGFSVGDLVGEPGATFGSSGKLYDDTFLSEKGPLKAPGSTAYIGFRIQASSTYGTDDGLYFIGAPEETYYGYIELTRGSVILGDIGLSGISGASVLIPASSSGGTSTVPLPAGMPLLLAGLGGFAALRRKARA